MQASTVTQLWRYPVKSMAGERLDAAVLGDLGVPGDRAWAVRDEVRGGIRGAKKIPALMLCAAALPAGTAEADAGRAVPRITLPDGTSFSADAPDAAERVGRAVGHRVTLWPRRPADDLQHYLRGAPDHEDLETELRTMFGRQADEPLPDLSLLPQELMMYESPPGTYFDAFPLLLLTESTMRSLEARTPGSVAAVERFRPNLVLSCDGSEPFPEQAWVGRTVRVGQAELVVEAACPRCVMITHPVGSLPRDPAILRTVVREAGQNVGVYARVSRAGRVAPGDALEVLG